MGGLQNNYCRYSTEIMSNNLKLVCIIFPLNQPIKIFFVFTFLPIIIAYLK